MSAREQAGHPAFPITEWHLRSGVHPDWRGMSLRDYFAAAALAHPVTCRVEDPAMTGFGEVAEWAYKVADAMLAEREK